MKTARWILAGGLIVFGIVAGLSSIREWVLLANHSDYRREVLIITGTRSETNVDAGISEFHLQGRSVSGEYEFAMNAARYQELSKGMGDEIVVFRNPSVPSVVRQKEGLNVFLEENWREREAIEIDANLTMWLTVISLAIALALTAFPRLSLLRREERESSS